MKKLLALPIILTCLATSHGGTGWTAPLNLGPGSGPRFITGADRSLSLVYEGDRSHMQAVYRAGSGWCKATPCAGPDSEMSVTDSRKVRHAIANRGDGIYYSYGAKGNMSAPRKIIEPSKSGTVYPVYVNVDARGALHLLYAKSRGERSDLMYASRAKNGEWESRAAARNIALHREWQKPGVAMTPAGEMFVCTYDDLYVRGRDGRWTKEKCDLPDNYMPARVACGKGGALHFLYYSWKEHRNAALNGLYYAIRASGRWSAPVKVGDQNSERVPHLAVIGGHELWVAWEDPDGNIRLSMKRID